MHARQQRTERSSAARQLVRPGMLAATPAAAAAPHAGVARCRWRRAAGGRRCDHAPAAALCGSDGRCGRCGRCRLPPLCCGRGRRRRPLLCRARVWHAHVQRAGGQPGCQRRAAEPTGSGGSSCGWMGVGLRRRLRKQLVMVLAAGEVMCALARGPVTSRKHQQCQQCSRQRAALLTGEHSAASPGTSHQRRRTSQHSQKERAHIAGKQTLHPPHHASSASDLRFLQDTQTVCCV